MMKKYYIKKYNFKKGDKIGIKDIILKDKDIKLPWKYTE